MGFIIVNPKIKFRVGSLIRKYGPRYFEEALRKEGIGPDLDLVA